MTTDKEWVQVLDHTSPSFVFLCSLYLTEFRGPFIVFIAIIFFSFTSFFFFFKSKALVVLDNSHSWGRHLSGFCAPNPHMQPPNGSAPHARVCLNLAPMPTINIKSNKTILSFLFTQNKTKIKSSYSLQNDPMPKPLTGGHVAIDVISVPCILYYFAMSSWPTTGPT